MPEGVVEHMSQVTKVPMEESSAVKKDWAEVEVDIIAEGLE